MKKIIFIVGLLLIFGCNNSSKETNRQLDYSTEDAEEVMEKDGLFSFSMPSTISDSYMELTEQKLNEIYEKAYLNEKHTDFKIKIDSSVINLLLNDANLDLSTQPEIKNVRQLGPTKPISDTVDEITISYEVHANQLVQKDTVTARISKSVIEIDGDNYINMNLEFISESQKP